ncbi:MAG TPA: NADH-quinone oxidoreductase subunit L [Candidatus Methylomirabilis sp.]|nr:NADH-quinone oxidoreductase subunit L [Candidatus Methylomirabilis sp.]
MTLACIAVPLLPMFAFLAILLGGHWLRSRSHLVALAAAGVSFALSVAAAVEVVSSGPVHVALYTWIGSGSFVVRLGLYVDRLTVIMLVMVTAISGIVQAYSVRYMQGDTGYARFFSFVCLFTGSMLMLVMSDNLAMMFVFWEAVGLCSYLLIGFTYERKPACDAAVKAFWVNRVGDMGFLLGILLAWTTFGTLDSPAIMREAGRHAGDTVALLGPFGPVKALTLITMLFLCGALAKSAQLPFHVWLPDAMEAPTPVSALIHAATMVTAGVFLIARFAPLFDLAPVTLSVLAFVGASSAFFAASVSMVQTDIKRVLAYSTMCQLGYMMLACGLGAYGLAIFHLVAHAAFKALLFLTAGMAVEEVAAHEALMDSERPVRWLPGRFWFLWISGVALAAMPPLVLIAGGKGLFQLVSSSDHGHPVFWTLAWGTALMTIVYLVRLVGTAELRSGPDATPLRLLSPRALGFVIGTAGVVVLVSVWAPLAGWAWFERFMASVLPLPLRGSTPSAAEGTLTLAAVTVAALALLAAAWEGLRAALRRRAATAPGRWDRWGARLYVVVLNRGYVDEIYRAALVRPALSLARWLSDSFDAGVIDRAIDGFGAAVAGMGERMRQMQSGQFHEYAIAMLLGVILLLGFYLMAG